MAVPQFPLGVKLPSGKWVNIGDKYRTQIEPHFATVTEIEYATVTGGEIYTFTLSNGNEVVVEVDQNQRVSIYRQPQ